MTEQHEGNAEGALRDSVPNTLCPLVDLHGHPEGKLAIVGHLRGRLLVSN
jgi:hypothetical protein